MPFEKRWWGAGAALGLLWLKPTLLCALGQSAALSELSFHRGTQEGERTRSPGHFQLQTCRPEQPSSPVRAGCLNAPSVLPQIVTFPPRV